MKQVLRYSFVVLLAMIGLNVNAQGVTFDFDNDYATLFPTLKGVSSSSGDNQNDGDFTEATTSIAVSGFTVTVSAAAEGVNNANRIWSSAPRLRMYSGTFTVSGKGIKRIDFTGHSTNFNLSTETGKLDGKVWTGEADEIVFAVAKNTQINKIVINGEEQKEESYTLVGAGTLDNPFTAKDAIYLANKGEYASQEVYITGKVFKVYTTDENITKYGNIDYYISEDGQTADPSFEIYRGKYFENANFTVDNKVKVGDEVVVFGKLTMHNSQAETAAGAILIKLNGSTGGSSEAGTLFSWEGGAEGATVSGGTATYENGETDESKYRVNYKNGNNYTICINGKKGNMDDAAGTANGGFILISLDKELAADDAISLTGYINKNEAGKEASIFFKFEKGEGVDDPYIFGDADNIDETVGGKINTHELKVPADAAGSKNFKMSRSKAGTNVFLTKLTITRGGASGISTIEAVRMNNEAIYNLAGQKVDENYKGVVIKNGKKFIVK